MSERFAIGTVGVALLLAATGCDDDFTPKTQLDSYRVIGVEASPPEATPDDAVTLTAHDFSPDDDAVSYQWSVCLYGLGAAADFECADPSLEFDLGTDPTTELDLAALGLRDRLASIDDGSSTDDILERGFDVWVRLESGPDCSGCSISTAKRVRVRESDQAPNENPVIRDLSVVGDAEGATTVTLRVDVAAPERYEDPDTREETTEEFLYTWYTTAGETDPALTFGDTRSTELRLTRDDPTTTVVVAVRDGRGGLAVESLVIER